MKLTLSAAISTYIQWFWFTRIGRQMACPSKTFGKGGSLSFPPIMREISVPNKIFSDLENLRATSQSTDKDASHTHLVSKMLHKFLLKKREISNIEPIKNKKRSYQIGKINWVLLSLIEISNSILSSLAEFSILAITCRKSFFLKKKKKKKSEKNS